MSATKSTTTTESFSTAGATSTSLTNDIIGNIHTTEKVFHHLSKKDGFPGGGFNKKALTAAFLTTLVVVSCVAVRILMPRVSSTPSTLHHPSPLVHDNGTEEADAMGIKKEEKEKAQLGGDNDEEKTVDYIKQVLNEEIIALRRNLSKVNQDATDEIRTLNEEIVKLKKDFNAVIRKVNERLNEVTKTHKKAAQEKDNRGLFPTTKLHNGVKIPLVGLGCASGVREKHVSSALSIGYTFFDTAQSYGWGYHEDEVGTAVHEYLDANHLERDEIFLQTKIHPEDLGYEATKKAVQTSLERLGSDHLDSVLIHKPNCWEGACTKEPEGTWQDSWIALEELYDARVITKAIGICDVTTVAMLKELFSQRIKPHIIQNYFDPFHQDKTMREKIQGAGILYQAYSSLGTQWENEGYEMNPVLNNPALQKIAKRYAGGDVGQIIINWATTRHKVSVIPASTNRPRQRGNLYDSFRFTLPEKYLQMIDDLDGKLNVDNEVEL